MKKFILIFCFITFYSFSQGIELPKINNVEELMKAEKPAPVAKTIVSDTSDYGMNLDMFRPKTETKPRFDDYTDKPAVVKVEKEQIFNTPITSVTSNNYNSIIFTLIFIVLLVILLKLIYK